MWVYFGELNASPPFTCLCFQQTADNTDDVKEIEQRVQSLSSILASPVSEDDYAEKWRRSVLRRFALMGVSKISFPVYLPIYYNRKLEGVITKLEPLSEQHVLLKFLCNVDNAKTLAGFIKELADAVTDYQV